MAEEAFIHLCQPDSFKSCGACCGLYNYVDSRKESLIDRLSKRTEQFQKIFRRPADLPVYSEMIRESEEQAKRYEVIYCCEYLGFLEQARRKVGCLLHPSQNNGLDLREISFYGKELCNGHFCPSYHYISPQEKLALIYIIDDWYLYGLCVTDIDLVKDYFRLIGNGVYETPSPERFKNDVLRKIALRFFLFKISWPFRSSDTNRLGKYYFDGSLYMISHIDYESMDCEKSRFDRIFVSLSSEFKNEDELHAGENIIQANIDEFISAYRQYSR